MRTVSRWLSNGLLSRPSAGPATRVSIAEPVSEAQQDWTARDLLDMGMSPDLAARTLQLLENATEIGSVRIREWFSNYIPMAAETPEVWAATIAFFQILARDIHNPALATLGGADARVRALARGAVSKALQSPGQAPSARGEGRIPRFSDLHPQHREEGRTPATGV